jgi:hypothetical protein
VQQPVGQALLKTATIDPAAANVQRKVQQRTLTAAADYCRARPPPPGVTVVHPGPPLVRDEEASADSVSAGHTWDGV